MAKWMLLGGVTLLILLAVFLVACTERGYYAQAVKGHVQLLLQRRPVTELIAAPTTPPQLKEKLSLVLQIREFASQELLLPDNASYRSYVDLGRSHVVWNVVAAPEFSLEPLTWCFPIAGCVSYRGYYAQGEAEAFAAALVAQGYDTDLYGVSAYSTLGWFSDPVLNTFLVRPEPALAGLIFHELAHQQLYVKDDSTFNEGFAEVVEEEGVRRWLERHHRPLPETGGDRDGERQAEFLQLLLETRQALAALYASGRPLAEVRAEKTRILAELPQHYRSWRDARWPGFTGFDRWFDRPVNNARLASVATYNDNKPAWRALLRQCAGDLVCFYREAGVLAALPRDDRRRALRALAPGSDG